ncbi:MAG TPA: PAS domain S-box protein [Candidatus Acidoferrales bacterium]|nr:PAS domain S-box protein [Candidatus Acidoferrales bacterium]
MNSGSFSRAAVANSQEFVIANRVASAAAVITVAVGAVGLFGWAYGIDSLKNLLPGPSTMKANTAFSLLLLGISLWLLRPSEPHGPAEQLKTRLARVLALIVVLIGIITTSEHLFGWNAGIDEILFADSTTAAGTGVPGRMGINTAACLILLGLSLIFLDAETRRKRRPAQALALTASLIAFVALIGYLYSVAAFYRIASYTQMALHTALTILGLGVGVLFARPNAGMMATLTQGQLGSVLLRRVLPVVVGIPLLLGWLGLVGERLGYYDTGFGVALFATSNILLLGFTIWLAAGFLNRLDSERQRALEELRLAHAHLERRVEERTAELAAANTELRNEISERQRAEAALRNSEKWFSTTLGSIGDAVIATDQNGDVSFMNSVAQSLTGWTQEESRGKPLDLVFHIVNRETQQPAENPVKKVVREGKIVGLADHTLLISKDGRRFDIEDSAAPIVTGEGERVGVVLVFRDVTESKRIEEERDRFFNLSLDMICIAGFDGYFKQLNPAWKKTLGYDIEELLAKPFLDFIHPEDRERTAAEAQRQAAGKDAIAFENRYRCKDGSYRWFLWTATPYPEQQLIYAVAHDITDRKNSDESLRRSELRYRLFFESMPHPVWVYDVNSLAFLDVNEAAIRHYGYSRQEFLSMTIKDIRPVEDIPALLNSVRKAESAIEMAGTWVHRKKDGTLIDVEITSHKLEFLSRDARLVVATDVSATKRALGALEVSEEQLRSVVQTANDAIISADHQGQITYFNSAAERIFGYAATEVIGEPLTVLMPKRFHDGHRAGFARYLSTGKAHVVGKTVELAGRRKDGTEFPLELSLAEWKTKDGVFFTGILSDITERKRAEDALLKTKNEAERGSKFKDQFLSTMSHELRTPLNAVLGFSELLADERYGKLNEKQYRYVGHIRTGGELLLNLINDILDLSKIEAGRLELGIEEVPVSAAFAEVLNALRPLAEKKSLHVTLGGEAELLVRADAIRLKQILMNLVGNAIKFTPAGGHIELQALGPESLGDGHVRVEVRDSGPGIPIEEQKRIFEAFYRLRTAGQAPEGTGLGLAITQRLVELHGGELGLQSEPGKGSCFYFTLPALVRRGKESGTLPAWTEESAGAGATRILIIEDDAVARQLIATQLASAGYEPIFCERPQSALETAAALQPGAITLDLLMRPVTGWEILLELKNDLRTKHLPVVVVSIVDQPGVGVTLGADEYLVKPVEKDALLAAIDRCIRSRSGAPSGRPILVVEDESSTREVITEFLTSHNYRVAGAEDGAIARAMVEASLPELVILDLMLPKVSGFELLAEWRAHPRTASMPVFVLTSKDLTHEEQATVRSQAELLLRKHQPWQDELLRQLRRAVSRRAAEGA